jgi:Protein of unknown function (DUF3891)
MILWPENQTAASTSGGISAWDAVSRAQRTWAGKYRLVRQPDHARLSGELARHLSFAGMPPISDEILRGISLHDEGWLQFDCGETRLAATPAQYSPDGVAISADGKPLSFEEIKPGDFLNAWRGSISAAEAMAPIAGLIVSGHFYRLGRFGVASVRYSQTDTAMVREFLKQEEARHERLSKLEQYSAGEIDFWTNLLQFCDLLSLYLCCGSQAHVEFPQRLTRSKETIEFRIQDGIYVSTPSLFTHEMKFSLPARDFPGDGAAQLQWVLR